MKFSWAEFFTGVGVCLVALVLLAELSMPACERLHPKVMVFGGHALVVPPTTSVVWCAGAGIMRLEDRTLDEQPLVPQQDGTGAGR